MAIEASPLLQTKRHLQFLLKKFGREEVARYPLSKERVDDLLSRIKVYRCNDNKTFIHKRSKMNIWFLHSAKPLQEYDGSQFVIKFGSLDQLITCCENNIVGVDEERKVYGRIS